MGLNGFISKEFQKTIPGREKISLEQFMICLLNSKANPAQFGWKLDKLGVLFQGRHGWQSPQDLGLAWILQIRNGWRPCLPKVGRGDLVFIRQFLNDSHQGY